MQPLSFECHSFSNIYNKKMKKILTITLSIVLIIIALLITFPYFFKDKIKAKVDSEIAKKIDAKVFYGDLNLSIFKNFPQITVSLSDFGVVGNAPFLGDTLVAAKEFNTSFNVMSIFKEDQIKVNSIALNQPKILIKTLKDGSNNYNIIKQTSDNQKDTTGSNFDATINSWQIIDGQIVYDDRQLPAFIKFSKINHEGTGDIMSKVFELDSKTSIEKSEINYKGSSYLKDRSISFEGPINVDLAKKTYQLKEGKLQINDFLIDLAGSVQIPDTNINLDITFKTEENEDFKKLISLIPSFYTEEYKDIDASGSFTISGKAKGIYNAHQTPTFEIVANVKNGKLQFPSLSVPITNVNIDGFFENKSDKLVNTHINLKKFNLNLGKNPITGKLLLEGLQNSKVDGALKGNIDLGEITKIFPMKGLTLRGNLLADVVAKGYYTKTEFPKVSGKLNLKNGFAKSADFPEPIEKINLIASILNSSGKPTDTKINLSDASLVLQNEPFQLKGTIENLDNASWDLSAKGKLDLTRITAIFPVEGTTLKGKINADITTKGNMEAIKKSQYQNLNVAGTANLQDFEYNSVNFPKPLSVKSADLTFTPKEILAKNASGFLGKSDFTGSGNFSNYFGYVFNNESLGGNLDIVSKAFNMNEWLEDEPNSIDKSLLAIDLRAVEIPKNLNLTIKAKVDETAYERMKISEASGNILVNNGIVKMQNLTFNSLGGSFVTNGSYNSQDIVHPKFDFDLDLQKIDIVQSYQHLWVVRSLVPIAEYLLGNFTTKFNLSGELGQDMVPKLMSLSGKGLIKLIKAAVKENPVLKEVASKTKLPVLQNMVLQDLLMQTEIKDGRMGFKPFKFSIKDHKFDVGGFNSVDGSLDWAINIDAPTGKVGQAFDEVFKTWTGKTLQGTDRVAFELKMAGTFKQPKLAFVASTTANSIKQIVTTEVKAQIEAAKAKAQAELDKLKLEAEAKKKELQDKVTAEAERMKAEALAKKKELEDKARAEVERLKKEAEDKIREETDRLKKIAEEKIAEEKARLLKIAEEEKRKLEAKAKAKLDSIGRARAEKLQKDLEERAKKAAEDKRKAIEVKAKEAEDKAKAEIEAKVKAAEEKAQKELEEKKKAAEEELKKVVKKDTTGN
jgi:AsmA-like C-terminal region